MGNFSRPPEQRLGDATSKHYVGVRVEQGVPLLDADLHLLDGLHRHELEQVGQWMLGNGVPVGSDAFRVLALAGGGVNTIVLKAKTVGTQQSTIEVDPVGSTAAPVLGFGPTNAFSSRWGDSPALLTGTTVQPFALFAGAKLIVRVDGGAPETIEFQPADFPVSGIATASAAEVAAKISTAATISAVAGNGNDFFLRGGDGTFAGAGRLLVEGRMALIERGLRYREQPLYRNAALAVAWGVGQVGDIPTPMIDQAQTVFVDVWHREVARAEDTAIVDSRIDIQTAVSVRREWAVRVVATSDYPATVAARPAGHSYCELAKLVRVAGSPAIAVPMIVDLRETDASLRPEVAYRNVAGVVVVNTNRFRDMLTTTRNAARSFITHITTQFVQPPNSTLATVEVAGLETLTEIATVADHALGVMNAHLLGTRGALGIMQQLYDAEKRFVSIWQTSLLPLIKSGIAPYQVAFGDSITQIAHYLDGPGPGGTIPVATAIAAGNLDGAVTSQERIAGAIGIQANKPQGGLTLKYLGPLAPVTVQPNTPIDLKYEVAGSVTPDDDLDAQVFIDPLWTWGLKKGDQSTPFELHAGPGAFSNQFLVTITPPAAGQTLFSVEIHAHDNPGGVAFLTPQHTLEMNTAPPPSEAQYEIRIAQHPPAIGGIFQVPGGGSGIVTFQILNHTITPIAVDLDPTTSGAGWTVTKGPFALLNQTIPIGSLGANFAWTFAPAAPGTSLVFRLRARDHSNTTMVLGDVTISLVST